MTISTASDFSNADAILEEIRSDGDVAPTSPSPVISSIPSTFEGRKAAGYRSPTLVSGVVQLSAEEAQYILDHQNSKNRKLASANLSSIRKKVKRHGWVDNGDPFRFYTDGNVMSCGHRCTLLTRGLVSGDTVTVVMVWGVHPDAVKNAGDDKNRSERQEIERFDKTITTDEAATVGDICRRRADSAWNLDTCLELWGIWKENARKGLELCTDLDNTKKFSSQRKSLHAFTSLAVHHRFEDEVTELLQLLTDEITGENSTRLGASFVETWNTAALDSANESRLTILFRLLCQGLARVRQSPGGGLELNAKTEKADAIERKLLALD